MVKQNRTTAVTCANMYSLYSAKHVWAYVKFDPTWFADGTAAPHGVMVKNFV